MYDSEAPEVLYSGRLGCGKCVDEATPIWMGDGSWRAIRDVRSGNDVLSLDAESHTFKHSRVRAVIDSGVKAGLAVRLVGSDEVVVSEEHPFYVVTGSKAQALGRRWKRGDRKVARGYEWRQAKDLKPGDYVALPQSFARAGSSDLHPLNEYELLGYLLGDGSFRAHSGRGTGFTNSEPSVVDRVRLLLPDGVVMNGPYDGISYSFAAARPSWRAWGKRNKNAVQALVDSWGLAGLGSHDKFVPRFAFTSSDAAIAAIVSGLLVTDGWVSPQSVGFASVSERLRDDLWHCLRILGVYARRRTKIGTYHGQPHISFDLAIDRLEDLLALARHVRLGHKEARLASLIESKRERQSQKGANAVFRAGDVVFRHVRSVEPVGPRRMYDLSIEGTENFVGNGIVLHNTRVLCEKGDDRCRTHRGARVALTRLHRQHIGKSILPELRKTIEPARFNANYQPGADGGSTLFYPETGSELVLMGLDWPQKLQSTEWDLVLVEQAEEIEREHWQMISGRMRNVARPMDETGMAMDGHAPQQIVAACNPEGPDHFLFEMFRPDMGSHRIWTTKPTEMPDGRFLPPGRFVREVVCAGALDNMENLGDAYIERLMRMKGTRYYERMVLGKWVAYEGSVFEMWDTNVHVMSRPRAWDEWGGYPPPSWDRFRAVDFGYHPDPFVCQWWARSPQGDWIMYREIYRSRRIVSEHARVILAEEERELAVLREACERNGFRPPKYLPLEFSFADHDAEDRATLESEGVIVEPAEKDRSPGIQHVCEMLVPVARPGYANPVARVRFIRKDQSLFEGPDRHLESLGLPTCTIEEMGRYRYNPDKPGKTLGADHGCDALRYLMFSMYMRGDARVILV